MADDIDYRLDYLIFVMLVIKAPLRNSRVNWIYDPAPPPPRHATVHSRNSRVSIPSNRRKNEVSAIAPRLSPPVPLPSIPARKRRSRRRRLDRRANERERERERKRSWE